MPPINPTMHCDDRAKARGPGHRQLIHCGLANNYSLDWLNYILPRLNFVNMYSVAQLVCNIVYRSDNVFGIKTKYHRLHCFLGFFLISKTQDVYFRNLFYFVFSEVVCLPWLLDFILLRLTAGTVSVLARSYFSINIKQLLLNG